ncbi:MAG: GTPase HflX [Candidatus Cloacimonadota bacterium]|nr:GTPase HflX [Candidatus Cloacimonadota bacterium]
MKKTEKAILVGAYFNYQEKELYLNSLKELVLLSKTNNIKVVEEFIQLSKKPNPATFIGKGKAQEIADFVSKNDVGNIIFNDPLSPTQARNLAKITNCNVVDRTELILDIFANHARSKQSKLQVELAQLRYNYSRLRRMWSHLSRIEGGIGFRGPGEKQIELDRREISKKISILKERLELIKKTTRIKRKKRSSAINISLVGYTNSGKSTLFNLLTNENKLAQDKLFATLDSTTRSINNSLSENVVLTDTIGFIENLPHLLIESFYSTLMDVTEADLLVHLIDISDPFYKNKIESVDKVLEEIDCNKKNILMVFNKIDNLEKTKRLFLQKQILETYPHAIFISAKLKANIDNLYQRLNYFFEKTKVTTEFDIPADLPKLISFIYQNSEVIDNHFDSNSELYKIKTKIAKELYPRIVEQIDHFKFMKEIN